MLRRVPPIVLAAIATAVVAAVVVAVVVLTGGAAGRSVAPCTDALEAGPYGCVVFVSIDGSVGGTAASEPEGGAITYRIERTGGADRIVFSGGCDTTSGPVAVDADRYRVGSLTSTSASCVAIKRMGDRWAAALFRGTVRVDDRDDGSVVLTRGDRVARFAQVVAARS